MSALDLTRVFAMLMMIQGHTIHELTIQSQINLSVFPWNVWDFLRGLTAPTFLIVSGIVQVFANKRGDEGKLPKNTIIKRFRMSLFLIFIGYFLVFPADKIFHLPFIDAKTWSNFLQVNVLQMIGVSLLLLLFVFLITKSDKQLGILSFSIALIILVLTPFVHLIDWFSIFPEFFASFFSLKNGSIFPLFPFTGFLFFGVGLGTILKSIAAEKRYDMITRFSYLIGIIFILSGIPLFYSINNLPVTFLDPLKANPGMFLIRAGCVLVLLSIITVVYLKSTKYSKFYSILGKKALMIYIVHLILLYGLPWFPGIANYYSHSLPLEISIIMAIIVQILSLGTAYYYEISMKRFPKLVYIYKYSITAMIIYLIFV